MIVSKPPMGWNSWNTFGFDISESLIMETADAMVSTGLKDAGYEYIVIDDCWSLRERDASGRIVADPEKFPHGMKYLADYIHSKGLKFGMYSCAGFWTCAQFPGSYGHEFLDAQTFADFGVDYLKYDYCNKPTLVNGQMLYNKMGMALRATGRDILFSACNWGAEGVWSWIRSTGAHMYRSTGDIFDNFQSFIDIAHSQIPKLSQSGPNCFNDPDMLIAGMYGKGNVGSGGCTDAEYRMHFSLWCLMSAPLMIGCDIRNMNDATLKLLTDKKLIDIDQDPAVRQALFVPGHSERYWVLFKHLEDGTYAFGFYNTDECPRTMSVAFSDLGLGGDCGYGFTFENLETGEISGKKADFFDLTLEGRSCAIYKARLVKL